MTAYAIEDAPEPLKPFVARADAATSELGASLMARVAEEIGKNGPLGAIRVCRDEAQAMTRSIAQKHALDLGRTSHALRNPVNTPREWARSYVEKGRGQKADQVKPVVVDLGERVGVLRPIPTGALCATCHGPTEALNPELLAELRRLYPKDEAVGFGEGDLRGFFWAELQK